jgi:16S rRNA (guanine(966)-N(2))-methyltransferase RsmD
MRVIGGEFRSRRLASPPGLATRPTPDRLRESLFNILAPTIEGAVFVDAYAGCGSVGIEALSRGAARAIFIEKSKAALAALGANLRSLGLQPRARVIHGNVNTYLGAQKADVYFLDPPYELTGEYETVLAALDPPPGAVVIVQHAARHQLADAYPRLMRYRTVRQGDNSLTFYATIREPAP